MELELKSGTTMTLKPGEPAHVHYTCACGKVTTFQCHELWSTHSLTPCHQPLCGLGCDHHRHGPGTMGYPDWAGATKYEGDAPDGDGFWEWLKSRCRSLFWSDLKKVNSTYREICANFPPPAPWPQVQLIIGRRTFISDGPNGMRLLRPDEKRLPVRGGVL